VAKVRKPSTCNSANNPPLQHILLDRHAIGSSRRLLVACALAFVAMLIASLTSAAEGDQPGEFDYYVLVMTWAPSYCQGEGRNRKDAQCSTTKPRDFTLHGLWPQHKEGWPLNCPTGKRNWVPQRVIDDMADIMPSKGLMIHEYRAHGTCSGLEPDEYFAVARELYQQVRVPPLFTAADTVDTLSPEEIERAFIEANAWLKPEMLAVKCRDGKFLDLRICFGRDLFPRDCGINEEQSRLCRASRITVPPVGPPVVTR